MLALTLLLASISTPFVSEGRITVAPGTVYDRGTFVTTTAGRQAAYIVEVDAHDPLLSFEASLSNDRVAGLETTTAQANRKNREGHRAVAASNADFWTTRESPTGMHIEFGELIADGNDPRPTFGVKPTRELMLSLADVNTLVVRQDGVTRTARKINHPRDTGQFVIYTSRFAAATGTDAAGTEVVLTGVALPLRAGVTYTGTVSQVRVNAGNTTIGANDVILSGSGAAATFLNAIAVGQSVTFTTNITAGWESVAHAAGGGQFIVRNGAVDVSPNSPGFADVTHPRTAVGLTAAGDVVIAVVDGRQPGYSIGVRLDELGELMLSRGVVTAVNLDGGGSSTLAVRLPGDDGVAQVNRGSDGFERSVSNSLIVFSSAPTGPLAIANVVPSNASLFAGSATNYSVKGQDATYNKVSVDPATVSWSLGNPSVGSINTAGRFTSSAAGTTDVRAAVGSVNGATPAKVVDILSALEVRPNPAVVSPNTQQLFNLTGRDSAGGVVIVDNNVATWSVSGPIGTISAGGVLTASSSGTGSVAASADGVSGTATVDVGRPPIVFEDFEDITDMIAMTDRASATLTKGMRPNPVRFGTSSGMLTYTFNVTGTSAAYAAHPAPIYRPISDRPLKIGAWVYGNGSRHWLRGNVRDGNNVNRTVDFTLAPTPAPITKADCRNRSRGIDWIGWKYVEANISPDWPLPLKWWRIYVVETADLCDDAGSVFFDDLRAVYSITSEDLAGPEVSNVVPPNGKRVFTSRPEIGGTVKDAGSGVAPESIRLFVDETQVAATFDPVTGFVRYTPAAPLADGTHRARLEADDRAGNPALPFGDWSFIVYTGPDLDAPVIDRAQPLSGTTSPAGRPRISARIQDEYKGVDPSRIEFQFDGALVPAVWDSTAGVVWYAPPAPLSNGTHSVTLRAGDREATPNYATTSWAFTVNAIPQPSDSFRFTWIADGGYFNGTAQTSSTAILGEHLAREKAGPPSLLVFGGDIVENDQQINYDRASAALAGVGVPALVAAGNHEISGSLSRDRFWRTFGPTIAAVDYGVVDFLIVDVASSSFAFDTSQYSWIQSELARSDARTVFLVLHVPTRDPFASGHGLPASEGTRLEGIVAAAKAAKPERDIVVLSGDAHAYGRWIQDGVLYLISGGGGGGLDAIASNGGWYHRLHVAVDASGTATINVIPLLESIAVTPDTISLLGGDAGSLSAAGNFFTSTAPDITLPIADPFARAWTSSDPAIAEVVDGALQSWIPGSATITVASGGASGTARVTVTATLASLRRLVDAARAADGIDSDGIHQSLIAKLDAAQSGAPGGVRAFINEVEAQRGQHINALWADRLIANAEYVFRNR
jgi:hypothetical protein